MEFRIQVEIEVEDEAHGLSTRVPIKTHVIYRGGRWQAQAVQPPFCTVLCDSIEEALIQAAKEAGKALPLASPIT